MEPIEKSKLKLHVENDRHWDATFRLMAGWDSAQISKAKVMVVGAGALGNEVLKNLALLNVGNIFIIDFDTVEYANLCRSILFREADCAGEQLKCEVAARRIREINPNVKVQAINGDILLDIGLGIFRRMDVVIGCLDNRLARLFINRFCHKVNRTWIDGAIENFAGQLDVYKPGTSCYECQLTDTEKTMIQYRLGCADVAQRNAALGKIATTPISASIIGAMQVQEALKVIFHNDKQSLAGQHFKYEGMNNMVLQYPVSPEKEDCESHFTIEDIIEARDLTNQTTVGDLFNWITNHFKDENPIVLLGYEVVLKISTEESQRDFQVLIPRLHLSDQILQQYCQVPGERIKIESVVSRLDKTFPQQSAYLHQLGIPPLHILQVEANGTTHFLELTGDEPFLNFQ